MPGLTTGWTKVPTRTTIKAVEQRLGTVAIQLAEVIDQLPDSEREAETGTTLAYMETIIRDCRQTLHGLTCRCYPHLPLL